MSCNCTKANKLPSCIGNLTIGVGDADTDYRVVFKTPDGRMDVYDSTSDDDGNIIVENPLVRTGTQYEIWAFLASTAYVPEDINEKETVSVDGTNVTCIYQEFTPAYQDENIETFTEQSISLV